MSSLDKTRYNRTARYLHWLIAGMIVLQFVLAKMAERADIADATVRQLGLLANHKSVGITILTLAIARLIWRLIFTPPSLPPSMPRWQIRASGVSHTALYLLIIALPVSGWLMSSASAYSVSWFNLFALPDFVAPNAELKNTLKTVHETLAKVLFAVALLHILAALKHALIDKDGVMGRMASLGGLLLLVGVIAAGVATLTSPGKRTVTEKSLASSAPVLPGTDQPPLQSSSLPAWSINYDASYIRFVGRQSGAKFNGEWLNWTASIHFSENALEDSFFDVTVNTREVDTQDGERDATMMEADWFNVKQFPSAIYQSEKFATSAGKGFQSSGVLIIKGKVTPLTLIFDIGEESGKKFLRGTANMLRLDHAVGIGEWEDTQWIGNEVLVEFYVESL